MKVVQRKTLSFTFGEDEVVKKWIRSYDPRAAPVTHETLARMNFAHKQAHADRKTKQYTDFLKKGIRISTQFDFWSKDGDKYASLNFTYAELGEKIWLIQLLQYLTFGLLGKLKPI
jgi:hypothetical protein